MLGKLRFSYACSDTGIQFKLLLLSLFKLVLNLF